MIVECTWACWQSTFLEVDQDGTMLGWHYNKKATIQKPLDRPRDLRVSPAINQPSYERSSPLLSKGYRTLQQLGADRIELLAAQSYRCDPFPLDHLLKNEHFIDGLHTSWRCPPIVPLPAASISLVPKGRIIGATAASFSDEGDLITDTLVDWTQPDPGAHPLLHQPLPTLSSYRKGCVANLSFIHSDCYYHWMIDVLPRLELIRRARLQPDLFVFHMSGLPYQLASLQQLGIQPDQVLTSYPNLHLQCDQLILPSLSNTVPWPTRWACDWLRRTFQPDPKRGSAAKRLYISRCQASWRRLLNEPEIIHRLQTYGFEPILLESLSIGEQAQLFKNAICIVAPHGAGLLNLVYCKPGTLLIELHTPTWPQPCYWMMSRLLQLDHHCLLGQVCPSSSALHDFTIDLDRLESELRKRLSHFE